MVLSDVGCAYQEWAADVIRQYGGYIAQYLGDSLLVYFGWPRAHEDDAQRAAHTSLGIVEAMYDLNTRLATAYDVQLAVRLGIHTDPVVVGDIGSGDRHEHLALGETPYIAAWLESLAQPGTVVISDHTRHLVAGAFNYDELGTPDLKGVSKSLPVCRVKSLRATASRFEATTPTLTPMIGREVEVDLLMRCWDQVLEGEGQVVLLNGTPGIGKSRHSKHSVSVLPIRLMCVCAINVPFTTPTVRFIRSLPKSPVRCSFPLTRPRMRSSSSLRHSWPKRAYPCCGRSLLPPSP
ncbi:hypothetical protein C2W62_37325 [Candidatus Entotheonella serta]|nr:hypothetical protein C2W62_37325 [Candidatus Entotheonella serta]